MPRGAKSLFACCQQSYFETVKSCNFLLAGKIWSGKSASLRNLREMRLWRAVLVGSGIELTRLIRTIGFL